MSLEFVPVCDAIGVKVRGIDLDKGVDPAAFKKIESAFLDRLVLLFRGQDLSDPKLIEFSRNFGTLDMAPPGEAYSTGFSSVPGHPEITVISNVIENGVPIGALGNGESYWHIDMTYMDEPPSVCCLYAVEVPKSGGNTGVSNMYKAYDALSSEMKARIESLVAIHDYSLTSAGTLRKGYTPVSDVTETPGARHHLVRTQPVTGKRALFLGRRKNQYIPGLSVEESNALLDELWAHACRPEFAYHHEWRPGDLLIWDNRCTMHRRDAFDNSLRRILHRTQVQGDRPYLAAA
jgi:taurine dioxygenase